MRLLGKFLLITGLALSALIGAANGQPPPDDDMPAPSSIDLTLLMHPTEKRSAEKAFVDFDQLISTNNPQWTMFGTNPPPANNMCTLDMADTACDMMVSGAKFAIDRHDHIIDRIQGLTDQDGRLSGLVVGVSGYYGTYQVSADRRTAIINNYNSFKTGAYRNKYNTVLAKKAEAQAKGDIASECFLSCCTYPIDSTAAQRAEAISNLLAKTGELDAANAALLTALNNAVSTANSLKSSSSSAAFPDGQNGFGGFSLEQIWVSQGMLYWWYISQGYVDRGHFDLQPNGELTINIGWPYGTPPSEQPVTWPSRVTTVMQWYEWLQPPNGFRGYRWEQGQE